MFTKFISVIAISVLAMPAFAAPDGQGRRTMSSQMMAPRQVAAPQVKASMASAKVTVTNSDNSNTETTNPGASATNPGNNEKPATSVINNRDKEKAACINNNIGVGNTFVWASRYSNTNNYTTMIEDVQDPDNNTCFVRVELKSSDSKVNISDIPARYFEMGRTITCGDWADEEVLKKRILDAKKSARTWATVGGAVGGAALGVGAMELFGNKLIGGAVEGQYALKGDDLVRSQLAVAYKNDKTNFDKYEEKLKELQSLCDDSSIWTAGIEAPKECKEIDYAGLLQHINGIKANK